MTEIIIDATNQIMGRICTQAAKQALLGNTIKIVNCEKAVITGNKPYRSIEMRNKKELGQPQQGPFFSKMPDRFVRRCVRGMLSYHKPKGKAAFKRVMCYIGIPPELATKSMHSYDNADAKHIIKGPKLTVKEITKYWGYNQ